MEGTKALFPSSPHDWATIVAPTVVGVALFAALTSVLCCCIRRCHKRRALEQQIDIRRSYSHEQTGRATILTLPGWSSLSLLSHQQSFLSSVPCTPGPAIAPRVVDTCPYVQPNMAVCDGSTPTASWCVEEMDCGGTVRSASVSSDVAEVNPLTLGRQSPWFLGAISRSQAEYLLSAQASPGSFLLRTVAVLDTRTDVCLSVLAPEGGPMFRHLLIVKTASNHHCIASLPEGSTVFESIEELLEFYCEHELHFQDSGPSLTLTEPCRAS